MSKCLKFGLVCVLHINFVMTPHKFYFVVATPDASAKLDRNGWAWFVSGTKLVVWNYKQVPYIKVCCSFSSVPL